MENFRRLNNAFMFEYERRDPEAETEIILRIPPPVPNARSINDICYIKSSDIELYGTISSKLDDAVWIPIDDGCDINKCVKYLKLVPLSDGQYINIRISMN